MTLLLARRTEEVLPHENTKDMMNTSTLSESQPDNGVKSADFIYCTIEPLLTLLTIEDGARALSATTRGDGVGAEDLDLKANEVLQDCEHVLTLKEIDSHERVLLLERHTFTHGIINNTQGESGVTLTPKDLETAER